MKRKDVVDILRLHMSALTAFAIGMAPISALSLQIFGYIPLQQSFLFYVLPVYLIGFILTIRNKIIRHAIFTGLPAGIIAVFIYDLFRWSFSYHLGLVDFIPKIGQWLLATDNPHFLAGYLWRYIGNGGGMGIAFFALLALTRHKSLKLSQLSLGIVYGVCIWSCLLITLKLSAQGEQLLFKLDMTYFLVTLLGHLVYGFILGNLASQNSRVDQEESGLISEIIKKLSSSKRV